MPFLSYAQNGEDVLLWRALGDVAEGFYVDVGAAHPDEDSVTRAFYDRGWRGLNLEPVPSMAARIADARPRDITLAMAAGASEGTAALHVVDGTGLSTIDPDVLATLGEAGHRATTLTVPMRPLAALLDAHAPDRIEFLKIDVEGAERAVLEGCDFRRHRPRVILLEATWPNTNVPTHEGWEDLLLAGRYRFALFDGLNRFYVADEWAEALLPRLSVPVNFLDNYAKVSEAPARHAAEIEAQLGRVMARAAAAEDSARAAYARAFEQARELGLIRMLLATAEREREEARSLLRAAEARAERWERDANASEQRLAAHAARAEAIERDLAEANRLMQAVHRSTSWRVTRPLRAVSAAARMRRAEAEPPLVPPPPPVLDPPAPAPEPVIAPRPAPPQPAPRPAGPLRAVHQFHSGSATGDAVTNSMLLIRARLRQLGYRSEIFVEHRDAALATELHLLADLPARPDYVLIVHHSLGYDLLDQVLAHPAPKLLYFHNITPPSLLPEGSVLPDYARLGRAQLGALRQAVVGAVAASEYNAVELRRLGFDPVWVSTLLFDLAAMQPPEAAPRQPGHPYTVLFVGRVIESKGQADLLEAFARFRAQFGRPARLVLAGRTETPGTYLQVIDARMRAHGLEAELVVTGPLSDAELQAQYGAADLYVSMSHHEGFGVPLVEATLRGIPVLAWPGGAIPYTLAGAGLLESRDPEAVAAAMLEVARDPARRTALLAAQQAGLARFALDRQWPAMQEALVAAGAAPPPDQVLRETLGDHLRFAVFGHTEGSYSLAAINRDLAGAIDAELPGRARLVPVEGRAAMLPAEARRLARRAVPETGPEVVISQHYPVQVPDPPGDLALALVFWEELLLPRETIATLAQGFDGVLAPSTFVAKALLDSGLTRPIRILGQAPDLARFEALAWRRRSRGTEGPFTFLHVSSCFPRKGVDVLLAAYAAAFRAGDKVRLVIKGFPNPHNTVPEQVAAMRAADPALPAVEVLDADLDDAAMDALYLGADAMVLPTRGEGYNLPAAEAMAAGLPLVVTGFGGQLDFCGPETARLLRYRLAPSGSHLASRHSLWAEPDRDDLAAALREMEATRRDPAAQAQLDARTQRARASIAQRTGRRALVRRLRDAALDIMLGPPLPPILVAWVTSWAVRCGVAEYSKHLIEAMPEHPAVAGHLVFSDDRSEPSPRSKPAWRLGDVSGLGRLERAITAEDPLVVVIQHQPGLLPWDGLAALLSAEVLRGRILVATLHSTADLPDVPLPARNAVLAALRGVARVVVHTLADLHRLQDCGLTGNVVLVPHGVREASARRAPGDPSGAPLIGCYGFFLPGKGIGELIQALAVLRRTQPGARLRLVNADYGVALSAEEIARCRRLAVAEGVADAIEWHTGFLADEESLRLLNPCDLIVIPTQASREASSAAVRTALAAGPPVLVTPLSLFDDAGPAVARTEGVTPADLAAGIERLLADPARQNDLQAAAQDWQQDHRWSEIAALFQDMLVGLAGSHGNVTL